MCGFCAAQLIPEVAVRVECETSSQLKFTSGAANGKTIGRSHLRVWVARFVVMQGKAVQNYSTALGNIHPVVHKIFGGTVRRRVPERGVDAQDLFDDGTNVRQVLLVLGAGPAVPSHNAVQFVVGTRLHVGMFANESEEPLNDAGRLRENSS